MNNLYFTYRQVYTNRGVKYDPSYYNDQIFADYIEAGLTKMIDGSNFIPSSAITKEAAPGIKSLRKAGVLKYNPNLDLEILTRDLLTTTGNFLLEIKTKDEMLEWVKENTNLVEKEPGVFIKGVTEEGEEILLTID